MEPKVMDFVAHSTEVRCLAFGPKSFQVLATGGEDCKVNIWRLGNASNIWSLGHNKSPIECLCFDSEEQCAVSGAKSGSIKVFDLNEGRLARSLAGHRVNVSSIQYHPYGEFIVSGSLDCTMKVWDVRNKSCIQTYSGHDKELTCARFSPDGRWVASSARDGQILLWDLVAGKLLQTLRLQNSYCSTFEFSPSEFLLGAVTTARTIRLWDLESMEPCATSAPDSNPIRAMSFHSGTSNVCVALKDNLKVWSWDPNESSSQAMKLRSTIDVGWDRMSEIKVSPGGDLVGGSYSSNFVSVYCISISSGQFQSNASSTERPSATRSPQSAPAEAKSTATSATRPHEKAVGYANSSSDVSARATPSQTRSPPSRTVGGASSSAISTHVSAPRPRATGGTAGNTENVMAKDDYGDVIDSRHGGNRLAVGSPPVGSARIAEAKYSGAAEDDRNPPLYSSPPRPSIVARRRDPCKEGLHEDYDSDGDLTDIISSDRNERHKTDDRGGGVIAASPEVRWETEHAAKDMATSMGDSFFRRFKDEGGGAGDLQPRRSRGAGDEKVDLEELLPPTSLSRFAALGLSDPEPVDIAPSAAGSKITSFPGAGSIAAVQVHPGKPAVPRQAGVPPRSVPLGQAIGHHKDRNTSGSGSLSGPSGGSSDGPQLLVVGRRGGEAGLGPTASAVAAVTAAGGGSGGSGSTDNAGRVAADGVERIYRGRNAGVGTLAAVGVSVRCPGSNAWDAEYLRCDALLDRMLGSSSTFSSVLSQRLVAIRWLHRLWEKGELSDAIDYLSSLHEGSRHDPLQLFVLADFFLAVELRGNGMCLDSCVRLLPLLDAMISSGNGWESEHVILAVLRSACSLYEAFGDLIQQTRAAMSAGGYSSGVDLSREERIRKCNTCHQIFRYMKGRLEGIRTQHRKSQSVLQAADKLSLFLVDI